MASDANDASAGAHRAGNAEAAHKEAQDYWGYLIKPDKCGTELFDRLLKGIAEVISKTFEPSDSPDLTPSQLAAFYRAVGGNYDVLFMETPSSSLSFIYRSLGATHSLQPAPNDDAYSSPTLPALKKQGYVTWQTIQLLLGPKDHVQFLQNAVQQFDVVDPETGNIFPKVLPKDCLPDKPDDAMEAWYETVAQRLKREAEEDTLEHDKVPHVRVDERMPRTSADLSSDSADEKRAAAGYFSDPLYRKNHHTRPPIVRVFSKQSAHPYDDPGRGRLISSVRHMWNPFNKTRRVPGRYSDESPSDDDRTPVATVPPQPPRYVSHPSHSSQSSHKRPHPPRRESTLSTTSDSDSDTPSRRRPSPVLRHRRSEEPATSPREYFPPHYEERRYSHDVPGPGPSLGPGPGPGPSPSQRKEDGPPPLYGPTQSPLFASHVAQMQAKGYYDRRPAMPARASYRPHGVRYGSSGGLGEREAGDAPYSREAQVGREDRHRERERDRERDRDRDRDRDRERERDGYERYRRRSEEFPREKGGRDEVGRDRTRSHDRVKDEWNGRGAGGGGSRERDRERERDRGRERERERDVRGGRAHRYVAGATQDGVGGRRYAVESPWR